MARGCVRRWGFVIGGLLLGALAGTAVAQELNENALRQVSAIYADKATWTPAQTKLDTSLLYAGRGSRGEAVVQGMTTEQDLALVRRVANRAGVASDGMVIVDLRAEVTDGLLLAIGSEGGKVLSAYPTLGAVRARVPIRQVEALAALPEVRFIGPRQEFLLNTGSQTSQGDTAHAAAAARSSYGLVGTGVRIGVLSDGVDSLAARQASGDLPLSCPQAGACVQVVPGQAGEGDEGTAMMEIIHDLAPGAQIYFATAFNGDASFATNILTLKNTYGCDIIVDDVTYFNEGAFQDGGIAQAVNAVKNAGGLYFSSAGNSGRKDAGTSGTWEGDYVDAGCPLTISGLPTGPYNSVPTHSFSGATGCTAALFSEYLNYGYSSGHAVTLKWSDPLGASGNDYDMFTYYGGYVYDYSVNRQDGNDDPFERVDGYPGDYIWVTKYSGVARALRLDTNRARLVISTAGAVVGHNGADGTISVAATDGRIPGVPNPFVGGTTNPVETYSSDGPRRMFYNPNGTAITPGNVLFGTGGGIDLKKPDITAADCVTTTTPGFIPFCGTSAAAPHAAAIAALLKSAANHPGGGQVLAAMAATALDVTPGAGWDRNSGVGIVMANAAAAALTSVPSALTLYTVEPCRVFDTREVGGPTAGKPLTCGVDYDFTVAGGTCSSVPSGAKAVSLNVTVTAPTAQGNVRLFASGTPAPVVSTQNYVAGLTRANNAVAPVNASGKLSIRCSPSGSAHVVLDVNGYFQ
jgi:hypothetical protein